MPFFRFIFKRACYSAAVILAVLTIVWVIVNQIGDPVRLLLPVEAGPELIAATRMKFGLDDPMAERFFRDLLGWIQGDFGNSLWQGVPTLPLVLDRLPNTILLSFTTLAFAVPLSIALAVISVLRPGKLIDNVLSTLSLAGVSIADFWLGLMFILIVAVQFGLLPTSGFGSPKYIILPVLTLAFRPIGRLSQVARSSLLEEMSKPYITTLRAQGMSEFRIVRRHAMKNSLISFITVSGDELASLLNGAVVIETIFAWPGIGSLFIQAITRRDLPLVIPCVLVIALMVVLVNLVIDLLYAKVDARASVY